MANSLAAETMRRLSSSSGWSRASCSSSILSIALMAGNAAVHVRPCGSSSGSTSGCIFDSAICLASGPAALSSNFRKAGGSASAVCSSLSSVIVSTAGSTSFHASPNFCSSGVSALPSRATVIFLRVSRSTVSSSGSFLSSPPINFLRIARTHLNT